MTRRLSWTPPETAAPKRPYRDSVVLYAVLAIAIVVIAWATGGSIGKAIAWAAAFFIIATAWSIWHWRGRMRRAAAAADDRRRRGEEPLP